MLVVDRRLAGILGAVGNWGVIFAISGAGAVLNPEEGGIGYALLFVILGIGSVLALMIGLTSLAEIYEIPVKEKTRTLAWATFITYILALIFIAFKPNSSIWAILFLVFIVLLIWTKKDVYVYTSQASSIFGVIARVYARVSRKVIDPHSGGSGNVAVVMTPGEYIGSGIAMQIFAFLVAILLWFTLEPIGWILWGFTGK